MKMEADYVMSTKFVHHTYRERGAVMPERGERNRIEITTIYFNRRRRRGNVFIFIQRN